MATKSGDWETGFGRIRLLLGRILGTCEKSREPVAEIFGILEELEGALRSGSAAPNPDKPGSPDNHHRRNKPKQYRVEKHGNIWCVAEHREGGRQAYLCPQEVYEALTAEWAEITEPIQFPALLQALEKRVGKEVPDYLLRTCVRFWMSTEPPLIEKIRTRYRPVRMASFARDAKRAWNRAAQAVVAEGPR